MYCMYVYVRRKACICMEVGMYVGRVATAVK